MTEKIKGKVPTTSKPEEGRKSKSRGKKDQASERKTLPPVDDEEEKAKPKKSTSSKVIRKSLISATPGIISSPSIVDVNETWSTTDASKSARSRQSRPKKTIAVVQLDPNVETTDQRELRILVLCSELAEEIWEESVVIFTQRFWHREKGMTMIAELRDTWLRILECSWMEFNIAAQETLPSEAISLSYDKRPLPPSHDMWARGTLELLPESRRESILDPFIRRKVLGRVMSSSGDDGDMISPIISSTSSLQNLFASETYFEGDEEAEIRSSDNKDTKDLDSKMVMSNTSPDSWAGDGDAKANTEQDSLFSQSLFSDISSPTTPRTSQDAEFQLLKCAVSLASSKSSHSGLKPWTISQCGMHDGTRGAFKLFRQTTSEAIRLRNQSIESSSTAAATVTGNNLKDVDGANAPQVESVPKLDEVETIFLNDPGTHSIYENAALRDGVFDKSPVQSPVSSQVNIVMLDDDFVTPTAETNLGQVGVVQMKVALDNSEGAEKLPFPQEMVDLQPQKNEQIEPALQLGKNRRDKTVENPNSVEAEEDNDFSNDASHIAKIRKDQALKRKTVTQKKFNSEDAAQ
ncbi:uncharacterized protein LOC118434371 isoform X2 [Folsomia candida]|uniref:uncharacterized protein LOC118434371 isoform X2 n=1 Tax=Folsomia candida TaxID=158441 RepID=UPI001604BA69|nr:uncharacterized protein LOC118434371 isoform X2 [Folsomia candida]